MEDEKKGEVKTDAEAQIERLMKLKLEKDKKDKMRLEIPEPPALQAREPAAVPQAQRPQASRRAVKAAGKKPQSTIRIEKRLFDKVHKLVNALNTAGGLKITKAKFVNMVLKEFVELGIDYNAVKSREELRKLFERMKTGN